MSFIKCFFVVLAIVVAVLALSLIWLIFSYSLPDPYSFYVAIAGPLIAVSALAAKTWSETTE
jgi:hypothetical protein